MEKMSGFPAFLLESKLINSEDYNKYRDDNNYHSFHKMSKNKIVTDKNLITQAFFFSGESVIDLTYFNMENVELEQDFVFNKGNDIIPIKIKDNTLYIVSFNPFNSKGLSLKLQDKYPHEYIKIFMAERKIISNFNDKLEVFIENKKNIQEEIKMRHSSEEEMKKFNSENNSDKLKTNSEKIETTANKTEHDINKEEDDVKKETIQRLMKQILTGAINANADEIHFEPYNSVYRVRFKQNNDLFEFLNLPKEISIELSNKIKEMAGIEHNKRSNYGNITLKINSARSVDFKVSVCPLYLGDKIVFNVINNNVEKLTIDHLGFETEDFIKVKKTLLNKSGVFIFNGARRSGKTYSMYSFVKNLNAKQLNIYTIEKNVGYYLDDINQVKITKEFSYDDAIEVISEQDPDVIMIDMIENTEMLRKVFKLAKTGRMVLFSMNLKSNKEVLQYLIQSGISYLDIYLSLKMINTQLLLKENCHECIEDDIKIPSFTLEELGFNKIEIDGYIDLWKPKRSNGCTECNFKKTQNLIPIHDVFIVNNDMKEIILKGKLDIIENMVKTIDGENVYNNIKSKFKDGLIDIDQLKELFN